MSVVTVKHVRMDWDMRSIHPMRQLGAKGLREGEVSLFVNKRCTIAKLVDCVGGLYQHWCEKGEVFDMAVIRDRVKVLGLQLQVVSTKQVRGKVERLRKKKVA